MIDFINDAGIAPSHIILDINQVTEQKPNQPKTKQKTYIVQPSDTLTSISKAHRVSVKRLWSANKQLKHPDQIEVSQRLKIPRKQDKLKPRPFPKSDIVNVVSSPRTNSPNTQTRGYSNSGNLYTAGYCTHFAKAMRPDLPNRMGDAYLWPSSARRAGFSVGTTPRVGAIAQLGNHVSYVTSVNSNGTFNVREQNWVGLFIISTRTNIDPSGYQFIY